MPVADRGLSSAANTLRPVTGSASDWCRCQPEENAFGSPGRHMNVASSPRRWQTCLTADRNSTTASAAASPAMGEAELELTRSPLVLDRPWRQADVAQGVPQRLQGRPHAVQPHLGQEL